MCDALTTPRYRIRFELLAEPGAAWRFRCDAKGRVMLDALSEAERENYLYARAMVGREFAAPKVEHDD